MYGNKYWDSYDVSYDIRPHPVFTAEYLERVLQSVFHTITIVAVYEIIKETFRRIEVMRLKSEIRKYETLVRNCCLQVYGCRTCICCTQLNLPTITYRAVPTSIYRAMEGRTQLWRKHPSQSPHHVPFKRCGCSTQENIHYLKRYLRELTSFNKELNAEQEFLIRERYRREELRRRTMAEALMIANLREKKMCPCGDRIMPITNRSAPSTSQQSTIQRNNQLCEPTPSTSQQRTQRVVRPLRIYN